MLLIRLANPVDFSTFIRTKYISRVNILGPSYSYAVGIHRRQYVESTYILRLFCNRKIQRPQLELIKCIKCGVDGDNRKKSGPISVKRATFK